MKAAAADWNALRRYADITPVEQLGRGDVNYNEDLSTQLHTLHNLHRKGHITDDAYNTYRTEFVGAVDPQRVYDAYRHEGVSHPDAQVAWDDYGEEAYNRTRQFYADAVDRGLMTPEQAQAQLNKVKTGAPSDPIYDWRKNVAPIQAPTKKTKPAASSQDLTFSYTPGKRVDTTTGQPVAAAVPRKKKVHSLPTVSAAAPVDLSHMTSDTLTGVIPGVTRAIPAPAVSASPMPPASPVVAPSAAPAAPSAPVKAPSRPARRQHTYEDALNNGWSADADNTYGQGWVYRDNGDGTRTYRSPSQIKKLDPTAASGGITVDAPKPAAAPKKAVAAPEKAVAAPKPAAPAPTPTA